MAQRVSKKLFEVGLENKIQGDAPLSFQPHRVSKLVTVNVKLYMRAKLVRDQI